MALFENWSMLLELKNLPFKEKKKLKSAVTENGGKIIFVVNEQCSLVVTNDVCNLSSNRLRSIRKHHTPVVGMDYIYACVDRGILLPVAEYRQETSPFSALSQSSPSTIVHFDSHKAEVVTTTTVPKLSKGQAKAAAEEEVESQEGNGNILERFRIYTEMDSYPPAYPDNFQVAKYSFFQKTNGNPWCVLELQSVRGEEGQRFRVVRYSKERVGAEGAAVRDRLVFPTTSEEALEVYQALIETLQASGLQQRDSVPPQAPDLGSAPLQQLLLEEKMNTGVLSPAVGVFVELLWSEALGCLGSILRVPISKLSLNDVSRAEGLLIQAHKKQREGCHEEVLSLLGEVNTLLPHKVFPHPPSAKLISQKLDLCQLIRDVLSVSEMCLRSPVPSSLGKYRALRCGIECIPHDSPEFQAVATLLQDSKVQIQQVLRVGRGVELQTFKSKLGNIKSLLHSSSPSNFVGILSRGLLLPCVGVEQHGISRTDVGNLGSGIYFSDAASTCLKYSKPSVTDGSRLLLVCDVALGVCKDVHKRDTTLTQAPEGHDSVHAVRRTPNAHSEFEDDEYAVYSPDQVKLKYVVQFITDGDEQKEFRPAVDISGMSCLPSADPAPSLDSISEDDSLENIKNPLDDVKAGLLDSSGQQLPLQAVHVKCKLMDLLSQVIIFQKYTNLSSVPIEAKYVFPLGDSAAVCGFEAFINGKHVVGQVKEKETARKEYKQAIEKGHGAYLMDQDAADVFTISVGNLPPGATVLIKVTFVSELIVCLGTIFFSLPGSVAPWQESMALNQTTQATLEKVCVTGEDGKTRDFTLDVSIEMPFEITCLRCTSHKVKMKKTDCKAVVSVLPGEVMGPEGFRLSITLSKVHLPRMWVENHPDEDLQACMLVFYPDFDINRSTEFDEVILLLDTSESMRGETLCTARRLALRVLRAINGVSVNVIFFGTDHSQAFQRAKPTCEVRDEAEKFIKSFPPVGGSTELWRPLRALSLLPPSRGIRNILLFSDGHIQNAEFTLRLLRDNAQHSRLFTCGLSTTANRHMLRALTQAGGGAYEFFDTKTKHTWAEKVTGQVMRMKSPGCNSVSVKWQQFNPEAPRPVQAPQQVHALFNDCPTLVYGFVAHCTQATLLGNLSGQELNTMVSTTELQKTKGTFLHKLTARALIRDYEDGNLDSNEAVHEGRKAELKSYIIKLSKEYSILTQFTSFVAIEERDPKLTEAGFTDIPKLIAEEDVDILPYIGWAFACVSVEEFEEGMSFELDTDGMEKTSDILDIAVDDDDELMEDYGEISAYSAYTGSSDLLDLLLDEGSMQEMSETSYFAQCDSMENEKMCSLDIPTPPSPPAPPPPPPCLGIKDASFLSRVRYCGSLSATDISTEQLPLRSQFTVDRILARSEAQVTEEFETYEGSTDSFENSKLGRRVLKIPVPSKHTAAVESPVSVYLPALRNQLSGRARTFAEAVASPSPPPHRQKSLVDRLARAPARGSIAPFLAPLMCGGPQTLVKDSLNLPEMAKQQMRQLSFGAPAAVPSPAPTPSLPGALYGFSSDSAPPVVPSPGQAQGASRGFGSSSFRFGSRRATPSPTARNRSTRRSRGDCTSPVVPSLPQGPISFKGFGSSSSDSALPVVPSAADTTVSFQRLGPSSSDSTPPVPTFPAPAPPALEGLRFLSSTQTFQHYEPTCAVAFTGITQELGLQSMQFDLSCDESSPASSSSPYEESEDEPFSWQQMSHDRSVNEEIEEVPARAQLHDDDTAIDLTLQVDNSMRDGLMLDQLYEEGTPQPLKKKMCQGASSRSEQTERKSTRSPTGPELLNINWTRIFSIQRPKGYWEPTTELSQLIDVNLDVFANEFLKNKGIQSLGVKAHADILRLLATLLVLQLLRVQGLTEGKLLRTLFYLEDSPSRPKWWGQVKLAVDWVLWADRQYPCIYSRLEFGQSWESSTRQLLGCDRFPPFSPLRGLKLREPANILLVH